MKSPRKYMKLSVGVLALLVLVASTFFISEILLSKNQVDSYAATTIETPLAELPDRLLIPSIGVDTAVQLVGLATSTGQMEVPDNFTDVGWYKHGPRPGMPGSAVITGHLNGKNVPEAVFYDLSDVELEDEIHIVDVTGATSTFKVVKVSTYTYDSPTEEVFISNDGKVRLNLITCAGDWIGSEQSYNQRTVVFTELVADTN